LDIVDEPFHRRARLRSASTGPLIRSIRTDGLMIDSLLNPGDQIVSINGQAVSSARSAKNTLAEAKTHITILAKTKERTVAVVTTTPQMGTRSSIYDLYGTPVQARRLHEAQQSRSSTYDTARMTCNIAALILSIVTLFFPSDVGLFITDINWLFALISIFTLVNLPWHFRRQGSRISTVQIACNMFILGCGLYLVGVGNITLIWACVFYLPALILINVPSLFVAGDGSEDDAVDEISDDSNSFDGEYTGPATTV